MQAAGGTSGAPVELVIFDCDGVLVDSEPLAIEVLRDTIAALGTTISQTDAYRDFLGRSLGAVSLALRTDYGVELDADAIEAMRHALFDRYRAALVPMPGIGDVLGRLDRRVCVASSSQLERIRISLELTGLAEHFGPHVFSASMVRRGKPAPDLFLFAARQMGVAPENCLVIEDSPAGIRSAQAAGMRVFAFTGGSHVEPAGLGPVIATLGAEYTFSNMQDLPDLLRSMPMTSP